MSVNARIQNITGVMCNEFPAGELHAAFDVVEVSDSNRSSVSLFLPASQGAAVAEAIRNAITPAVVKAEDAA